MRGLPIKPSRFQEGAITFVRFVPVSYTHLDVYKRQKLKCLILPALTQSLMTAAILIRDMRNSVVDIVRQDYVDFAKSKGLSAGAVRRRHIIRNSMVSTVTLLSMRMAALLGGSVIIETVFEMCIRDSAGRAAADTAPDRRKPRGALICRFAPSACSAQ